VSTQQPTTGASLRADTDRLAAAIRQQLRQKEKEKARELLLRGLAAKREITVLTRRAIEDQDQDDSAQTRKS
jgi:hypothetical protein